LPIEIEKDVVVLKVRAQVDTDIEHLMSPLDAIRLKPKPVLYCFVLDMANIMERYQVGPLDSASIPMGIRSRWFGRFASA
jgi:hypothetical protein